MCAATLSALMTDNKHGRHYGECPAAVMLRTSQPRFPELSEKGKYYHPHL